MSGNSFSPSEAARYHDLTSLVSTSDEHDASGSSATPTATKSTVYPTEDTIAALLHARARAELPYTRVSPSGTEYIVVNPLRLLSCLNEESRAGYADVTERTDGAAIDDDPLQPSVFELAGRAWRLMQRQQEDQTIVYHGLTGSGKSTTSRHVTSQILKHAATTKAQRKISDQVAYLDTVLEAFGNSKTAINPSASQHGKYLELHFTPDGAICGAKALAFGLNKTRVGRLAQDERTFHVFYQMLAGASPDEREELGLDDPDMYALLASSGCYHLPAGPFSDDSTQLGELRAAMASLGFKAKHVRSIFSVLTAILVLSNITFVDDRATGSLGMVSYEERTQVVERELLVEVSHHLGVNPDDLETVLVNRTKWVSHDLASVFLDADTAGEQRDSLMRDLYAILFAFVVELANRRIAPPVDVPATLQIAQLDVSGHQSRTLEADPNPRRSQFAPLVAASGQNGFSEFSANFINEVVHSYLLRRTFDDVGWNADMVADGIHLPTVPTMDNIACIELLRGGPLGSEKLAKRPLGMIGLLAEVGEHFKGEDREEVKAQVVTHALGTTFAGHPSFVPRIQGQGTSAREGRMFGINHYSGRVAYDASDFLDRNADVLDKQLVELLRGSHDPFIAKLVSGPALATEGHPLDEHIVVEAQVSVSPLRTPTPIAYSLAGGPPQGDVAWPIDDSTPQPVAHQLNGTLATLFDTIDRTRVWTVLCLRSNDSGHANSYDRRRLKSQVQTLLIPDLVKRRQTDFIAEYPLEEFCTRHSLSSENCAESIAEFAWSNSWKPGTDYGIGNSRIWLSWSAWRGLDDRVRALEAPRGSGDETLADEELNPYRPRASTYGRYGPMDSTENFRQSESMDNLLARSRSKDTRDGAFDAYGYADTPSAGASEVWLAGSKEEYDHLSPEDAKAQAVGEAVDRGAFVTSEKRHHATEVIATTTARRWWIRITWLFTWWIPSFLLTYVGRMKRADVRMAWREKVTICMMIALLCGTVIFYIVAFGRILCPDMDKAWNTGELRTHQGDDDYYGAIYGKVYDFTKFYKGDHSDIDLMPTTTPVMMQFAGQDLSKYFPKPIYVACNALTQDENLALKYANFTPVDPNAIHNTGRQQTINGTKLQDKNWWWDSLSPTLQGMYKGSLVFDKKDIRAEGESDTPRHWAIYQKKVYDLSDYIYTVTTATGSGEGVPNYAFLNEDVTKLFQQSAGQDITKSLEAVLDSLSPDQKSAHLDCLDSAFYTGELDFRTEAKCTVQNYLLLVFSIMLMSTIGAKFLAALQLGGKRNPEMQDKFVVCQVPCYTEGEESLKKTIDSLAVLQYDDKRKLIFIICDGNIIGSGNNRPTPRIVLDILGIDPKLDPEPLLFKSIGEGSKKLNYGKIYSGLYEHEGHVVPYVVVVKVGKPTETSRPGNRGKRDSQVLLMQYLNRVHFDAPMCPLELEIYHQMRNVIGIDPTFYEYIFQVDADTTVAPDSLNRLISCTADDSAIIGICGETKVANERESLTTMIQVYEYYISHHLTKAFESLFGSVTCLPGCFSVYRIRTADKGRPVIISSIVIDEYAEPNVDTLHKKNLFSLGEDRYLTTLMMKHFPTSKMKFTPDALAYTVAPSRWNVLLSQRRRWINSTIHNLVELLFLPEMCGFCLFSMRFIVFVDLLGTIILPATFVYLVYLIVVVSTQKAAIPYISIGMIAAMYGLQAILFILKREFMLIGWMIVYILAFPIYSLLLPLYSFWSMDDFSWGTTRKVIGEGNNKTVVYDDDQPFEESMIPYRTFKEYEANAWETTSLPSDKDDDLSDSAYTANTRRTPHARRKRYDNGSIYSSNTHLIPPSNNSGHSSRGHSPAPYMSQMASMPSMGNMSAYGRGSVYDQPYGGMPHNPFDAQSLPSATPMFPPYAPSPLSGGGGGMLPQTRASMYSLATTANPFGVSSQGLQPNTDPSPTDATVLSVLKTYLNSQDLMTVTKRSAREAMYGLFPNAGLKDRAAWLNENIDKILSEA